MRSRILALFGSVLLLGSVGFAQTPVVQDGGIANAAGLGHSTSIAPGSLISIFGSNLASSLSVASSATLSTSLGDVDSVMINGMPAPLSFVSEGQINAQAPWELGPGPAEVVVTRRGVPSPPATKSRVRRGQSQDTQVVAAKLLVLRRSVAGAAEFLNLFVTTTRSS